MERRRSPGVLLSCYAGLIGLAVGHDFVMVFAAITLAATLVQAGSFTLMGLAPQYYPTIRRGIGMVSVRLSRPRDRGDLRTRNDGLPVRRGIGPEPSDSVVGGGCARRRPQRRLSPGHRQAYKPPQ
jgi:hypothetical protein